jgi:hypothetical protein
VIESFRNRLWTDYKTGASIKLALLARFHSLEGAFAAMGVVVWPMIELEADDARCRRLAQERQHRSVNREDTEHVGLPHRAHFIKGRSTHPLRALCGR